MLDGSPHQPYAVVDLQLGHQRAAMLFSAQDSRIGLHICRLYWCRLTEPLSEEECR